MASFPGPAPSAALPSLPAAVGHLRGRSQGEGQRFLTRRWVFLGRPFVSMRNGKIQVKVKIMKIQVLKNLCSTKNSTFV